MADRDANAPYDPRCRITVARSPIARDEDGRWVYDGHAYAKKNDAYAARRRDYFALLDTGLYNYTQAAALVGVSKRTGKVWRHGRNRASGRNENPCHESGWVPPEPADTDLTDTEKDQERKHDMDTTRPDPEAIGSVQYDRVLAMRPVHDTSGEPFTDAECNAVWQFVERQALTAEINFERNYGSMTYPEVKAVNPYLREHPERADAYYDYVWDTYWDRSFNEGGIDIIAEASVAWLEDELTQTPQKKE